MFKYDHNNSRLIGPHGGLSVPAGDQAALKMAMLLQGECTEVGPTRSAQDFNYSTSRYYQLRDAVAAQGVEALLNRKTGPKRNYRRTPEITKLVIRARFLDPDASAEVIASRLAQDGYHIAVRSIERIIHQFGLQKKTPHSVSRTRKAGD